MRRFGLRSAIVLLAALTTIGVAWSLAAWMPRAMYPRDAAYHFIADGRPRGASKRIAPAFGISGGTDPY